MAELPTTPPPRTSSSPHSSSLPRLASAKLFANATDSPALSTRGQHLPTLLSRRPSNTRSSERRGSETDDDDVESIRAHVLNTPQMRSQRLIGNSNPRYQWERYYRNDDELRAMPGPLRAYYARNNELIQHYLYIDRLLDSSLPHSLIQEYTARETGGVNIPSTIAEESSAVTTPLADPDNGTLYAASETPGRQVKRTPKNLYKLPEADENTPLVTNAKLRDWVPDEDEDTESPIVKWALYLNLGANTILLLLKIVVAVMTSSLSVLASLVDAALDFLSTAIVWFTSWMIARQDRYAYPVGRRRLEPIGVLIFSVIMMTSFFQVGIEGISRLSGTDHSVVQLTIPAVAIMACTVVIKGLCWLWCRLIRNSSVQALAQDAMTDVVFNTFSIFFPLVGYFANVWWLDALGGILLSAYVIINWSRTSAEHIRNLTGASATADERNILLYMTMRFAKSIKRIQGLQAYHAGDKLNVEVDIVVDEHISLRDSHDLGESLQYVLESVPYVDRAFVHIDYTDYNFPTHMSQQE